MITAEAALLFPHKKAALCLNIAYHHQGQIYKMKAGIFEGDRTTAAFLFLIAVYGNIATNLFPGIYPGMCKPPEVQGSSFYRPDKSRSPRPVIQPTSSRPQEQLSGVDVCPTFLPKEQQEERL